MKSFHFCVLGACLFSLMGTGGRPIYAQPATADTVMAEDPGWALQVLRRIAYMQNESGPLAGTDFARLHDAYCRGLSTWQAEDGTWQSYPDAGFRLSIIDWSKQKPVPAVASAPHAPVLVRREPNGTRFTLPPMPVTDDLLVSISFFVIDGTPENARYGGLDYLSTSVELFGGEPVNPRTSDSITETSHLDFWNSQKHKRYTITKWKQRSVGHVTVQTYGPLLFEVIDSEPDFMFINTDKIALSPQFKAGCRELCDLVLEQRRNTGQENPPKCRGQVP